MRYEIRDIVYGFITFDDWERDIINHPIFQRLRRIKQLSLTDMVYPGANHTRFEHSLGVMHIATLMFNHIVETRLDFLKGIGLNENGLDRERRILRFAALLHDVGHAPFSHAGEELFPKKQADMHFKHEDYSIAIIKKEFKDVIEDNIVNRSYHINIDEITALLGDETTPPKTSLQVWRNIISSQLDADRADYLLRDSMHIGVRYGIYDQDRLVNTTSISQDPETDSIVLAVDYSGWHVAESLVLARYQMFSQVYFHKTRRAYDYHIESAMRNILKECFDKTGYFPRPDNDDSLKDYIKLDDWSIFGLLKEGFGGDDGEKIINRRHDRIFHETSEMPTIEEKQRFDEIKRKYHEYITRDDGANKSWYKTGRDEIYIRNESDTIELLSMKSYIIKNLMPSNMLRLYAKIDNVNWLREEMIKL